MAKKDKQRLFDFFSDYNYIKELEELLASDKQFISVKMLAGSAKSITLATLWEKHNRPFFVLCKNPEDVNDWYDDLKLMLDKENLALMNDPKQSLLYKKENLDEQRIWLLDNLNTIQKNHNAISIATPEILTKTVPIPKDIDNLRLKLTKGQSVDFKALITELSLNGFERQDFVSIPGEIAVRGEIIDVYPIGWENPIRIDFWGDEIETIKEFDPLSQRSIREHIQIEFITSILQEDENEVCTVMDYLPDDCIFVLDSPEALMAENQDFSLPEKYRVLAVNKFGEADVNVKTHHQPDFQKSIAKFSNNLKQIASFQNPICICAEGKIHLERFQEIIRNSLETNSTSDELSPKNNYPTKYISALSEDLLTSKEIEKQIIWMDTTFSNGFYFDDFRLTVFTEHQLFSRIRTHERRTINKNRGGISIKELKQLHIGDYVTHIDKGIGRFDGFETVTLGGSEQDCVRLVFADNDLLYVNLNYIHKIQKYSADEGAVPKLSKLGSGEWAKKKERTKRKLKDIARELIKLYAERKAQPGYSFPSDTVWQKEFEASFIYEDTPDQASTTEDVKKDMQSNCPMDRLICGDVGFGKTEIAIRAAFKAVQSGKQAAVLVPTTVLAQQHYMTFSDRLSEYPVNIEVMSRFRTKAEQKTVVEKLKNGQVDILIGTHRILSKDIDFKDLGLLIIDEEHRFGVGSKEKLRQMRVNIDTLALTATPIPRTLNFSLMGARDLSVIETAPRNRLPIHTEIMEWNDKIITNAVRAEISRGGQVFFVTDKVLDIDQLTTRLQALMPTVRFGIAHGQMAATELERVMEKFVQKKIDVLVATKIIESGLDIPNANTMLVNRAQNFGLAELYQLRGRVGRSNIKAHCYLIIPPVHSISTNTLKRLQALEEFSELGSGFQLAMRDMELRGAGNLLGPEQSGYIIDIGFEMYQKILDEAVTELRIEEFGKLFQNKLSPLQVFKNEDVSIDIGTDALIPATYIQSDTERFAIYKKLYNADSNKELNSIIEELKDRFGKLPKQTSELLFAVKMRIATLGTGFTKVTVRNDYLTAEFPGKENKEFYDIGFSVVLDFIQEIENTQLIEENGKLMFKAEIENRNDAVEILWKLKKQLELALQETNE